MVFLPWEARLTVRLRAVTRSVKATGGGKSRLLRPMGRSAHAYSHLPFPRGAGPRIVDSAKPVGARANMLVVQ